jgi:3-hydroxyisobutyrate dehydrogenase
VTGQELLDKRAKLFIIAAALIEDGTAVRSRHIMLRTVVVGTQYNYGDPPHGPTGNIIATPMEVLDFAEDFQSFTGTLCTSVWLYGLEDPMPDVEADLPLVRLGPFPVAMSKLSVFVDCPDSSQHPDLDPGTFEPPAASGRGFSTFHAVLWYTTAMTTSSKRIGWIGTGVMGASMAGHLMEAGHSLTVNSRTKSKAQPLLDRGAVWADTPAACAEGADVAISMVGFPEDVEAVHLDPVSGTLAATERPPLIVDMSTSRPSLSRRIAEAAAAVGVASVDAPVSGGDVGARQGTLSIMVGGDPAAVEAVRPLLEIMGANVVHQGGPGAGQHTKMVNQILIATNMIGVCEGLLYASGAGLDPLTVIESVGSGAAGSWSINNLGPRMIRREVKALGGGRGGQLGTQALLLALERLNGQDDPAIR